MPVVIEPPERPPLEPPAEDGSELWELLYSAMGFHIEDDEANDFALRKFCEGLCAPLQTIYDLAREREEQKGWAIAFDPAECPEAVLPYLAQYVGVTITPEMSSDQIRAEITQPTGWKRGQPDSLRIATRRTLTGEDPLVIIRPRTPEPGHTYIRVLDTDCPDPARTEALVRAALPAWEMLDFDAITGTAFADIAASWESFDDLAGDKASFKDLAETLPTELPV